MNRFRSRKVMAALSLLTSTVAGPLAVTGYAQAPVIEEPQKLEKFTVTGSRLTGVEVEGALSVSRLNISSPSYSGFNSIADILRVRLPQFGGGVGVVNEGFANGGDGSAGISLRNLPENRTLLLLNGRRFYAEDLNLLPASAIEDIEILNDGASAIYGSDAVAGVVNVITKKNYDGATLSVRYSNTTDTDLGQRSAALTYGFSDEKGSFLLSTSWSKANAQLSIDRPRSAPLPTSISGTSNPGLFTPVVADPDGSGPIRRTALRWRVNITDGTSKAVTSASGVPASFDPVAYNETVGLTAAQALAARDAREQALNATLGANSPFVYGPNAVLAPTTVPGFPFGVYTIAYRPHERKVLFASAERKLFGEQLEIFTDFSFTTNASQNQLAPSPLAGVTVPTSNYWFQTVFPGLAPTSTVSFSYRPIEIGPRITFTEHEDLRVLGGLRGKLLDGRINWEVGATYERLEIDDVQTGGVLSAVYSGLLANTTPGAWNPFGYTALGSSAPVNGDLLEEIAGQATSQTVGKATLVDANVAGKAFELPAGDVQVSVGAEHRREDIAVAPDFALQNGSVFPFNISSPFAGLRTIDSVFAEVSVPIFGKDFNFPGANSLSVSAAARDEDYSDVGKTGWKPRFAVRWEPVGKTVVIRGSIAKGFVAPSLAALDSGSPSQTFTELFNPLTEERIQPEEGVIEIGNPLLQPSESESGLVGVVVAVPGVKDLTVGFDYYRIEETGIPFASAQYIVNEWFAAGGEDNATNPFGPSAAPSAANPLGAQVELTSGGSLYQVRNVGPINTGKRVTDGLDFTLEYSRDTSLGLFKLHFAATRVLTFEQEDFPGSGPVDYLGFYWPDGSVLGNRGFPEWRANTSVDWDYKRFSASVAWNFVEGYEEIDNANRPVDNYVTYDVTLGYTIPYIETRLQVGAVNVFDEEAPLVETSFADGYDRAVADIRGRMIFVSLEKKF